MLRYHFRYFWFLFLFNYFLNYYSSFIIKSLLYMTDYRPTLIVGLNPALQRTITLSNFEIGSVNRATEVQVGIGGKGQNVVVASSHLPLKNKPTLLQFLGKGFEGDAVESMLRLKTDSVISIRTAAVCRVCITLLASGVTTELIEPSDNIQSVEVDELLSSLHQIYTSVKPQSIAIMGSMPKNCPLNLYSMILSSVLDTNSKVLIDSVVDIFESVSQSIRSKCSCLVKINTKELFALTKLSMNIKPSVEDVKIAASRFVRLIPNLEEQNFEKPFYIALTDGPDQSHLLVFPLSPSSLVSTPRHWVYHIPKLSRQVISPIGAGDSTSAGTLHFWSNQIDKKYEYDCNDRDVHSQVVNAFRFGLACGSASCMSASNGVFEMNDVDEIFSKITIQEI